MIKNSILHIISSLTTALLNFVILIISAKMLGAEGRGIITYTLFYCGFIQIFTGIVGNSVLVFMLTKLKENFILTITFFWTIVIVLVAVPIFVNLDQLLNNSLLILLSITILQSFFNNLIALLSAKIQIVQLAILRISQPLILIASLFLFKNFTASSFLFLLAVSYTPSMLVLLWFTFRNFEFNYAESKTSFVEYIKLGSLNQLNYLMQFCCYRYAIWIIAENLSIKEVGIFGLWITMVDALWLIPISLATINQTYVAKKKQYLPNIVLCFIAAGITLTLLSVALLIPLQVYEHFLGRDFNQLKLLLLYSSPAIVFFTFSITLAYYFSAIGKITYNTIASGLGFIVTVLFSYFFITKYGLLGAVITNSVSYIISTIALIYLYVRNKHQVNKINSVIQL